MREGSNWNEQQKLIASDGAAEDYFGYSVALDGETALVGAYQADVGGNAYQGAAYLFVRQGASWSQQQKLVANDGAADDRFGVSVALSGETALVGATEAAGTSSNRFPGSGIRLLAPGGQAGASSRSSSPATARRMTTLAARWR